MLTVLYLILTTNDDILVVSLFIVDRKSVKLVILQF